MRVTLGAPQRAGLGLIGATAGIALIVVSGGSAAGADHAKTKCGRPAHVAHTGSQHGHRPKHRATERVRCARADPPASTDQTRPALVTTTDTQPAQAVLIRVPASRATLNLTPRKPDAPTSTPPPHPARSAPSSPARGRDRTGHATTTVADPLLPAGLLVAFTLAVSALVVTAGRRGGRHRAD